MTNSNGEIVSVQIDPAGRPFFYISHYRAQAMRQALHWIGLDADPSNEGEFILKDEFNRSDDGDEAIVFNSHVDPDAIQDALDELSWTGNRLIREVHP